MKHLALITDAWEPQINGVVTTLTQTIKRLRERGWEVTVLHPALFKSRPMPGYPEISLTLNPWQLPSRIKAVKPTHVHLAVEGPLGIVARYALKSWGWRYTTAYHTNFPEYIESHYGLPSRFVIPLMRWFHQYSAAVLTPSQSTSDKLQQWRIPNPVVWSRGFDSAIFKPAHRLGSEKQVLLYVGRVSQEKNIEDFLKLARPDRRLIVVGDGPARPGLQEQYPTAEFVGFKRGAELASFYQQADVFVFPSRTDTLGVVMIEAMACGTPIAAYRVEGPRDVVRSGVSGALHSSDLEVCVTLAAGLDRAEVARDAQRFSWSTSCDTFENQLVPIKEI